MEKADSLGLFTIGVSDPVMLSNSLTAVMGTTSGISIAGPHQQRRWPPSGHRKVSLKTIDLKGLAKAQGTCPTVKAYREGKMPKGLTMRDVTFGHDMTLYLDTSTGTTRHLVPAEWRRVVFSLMHNLTHTGPRATVRHVAKRYIWPEMSKQLTRWAQECHECQQSKTQRPIEPGVQDFEVPKKHFTVVHTDVVGPLPMSNGFKYVLTAINRTTRYLVAQSMEDASAKSCAKAFINWWQQHFSLPAEIVLD